MLRVQVPTGVVAGETFHVEVAGMSVAVVVPDHAPADAMLDVSIDVPPNINFHKLVANERKAAAKKLADERTFHAAEVHRRHEFAASERRWVERERHQLGLQRRNERSRSVNRTHRRTAMDHRRVNQMRIARVADNRERRAAEAARRKVAMLAMRRTRHLRRFCGSGGWEVVPTPQTVPIVSLEETTTMTTAVPASCALSDDLSARLHALDSYAATQQQQQQQHFIHA